MKIVDSNRKYEYVYSSLLVRRDCCRVKSAARSSGARVLVRPLQYALGSDMLTASVHVRSSLVATLADTSADSRPTTSAAANSSSRSAAQRSMSRTPSHQMALNTACKAGRQSSTLIGSISTPVVHRRR